MRLTNHNVRNYDEIGLLFFESLLIENGFFSVQYLPSQLAGQPPCRWPRDPALPTQFFPATRFSPLQSLIFLIHRCYYYFRYCCRCVVVATPFVRSLPSHSCWPLYLSRRFRLSSPSSFHFLPSLAYFISHIIFFSSSPSFFLSSL